MLCFGGSWERAWRTDDSILTPSLPSDSEHFLITFLPEEWRTVSREGIALHSLRYHSPDLIPHIFGGCKLYFRPYLTDTTLSQYRNWLFRCGCQEVSRNAASM